LWSPPLHLLKRLIHPSAWKIKAPPTWLHLDRSDPDVLTLLLIATDSMVSCFISRDARQQSVEREAREDYRERSRSAQGEVDSKRRHSRMECLCE
jgi:hypothetical protein